MVLVARFYQEARARDQKRNEKRAMMILESGKPREIRPRSVSLAIVSDAAEQSMKIKKNAKCRQGFEGHETFRNNS